MATKRMKRLGRILAGAVLFVVLAILEDHAGWGWRTSLPLFLIPYLIVGHDILRKALRNIARGELFDENFLMALATVGAFATRQFEEAVFVMLFCQIGEFFESWAVDRSRKSIAALMEIRPDYANIERDGALVRADPRDVAVGETIVVKPGEKIPLDGVVIEGTTSVDTAPLTGEPLPRDLAEGDPVAGGCVNINGLVRVRVTSAFDDSTVGKIIDLIEEASTHKAATENFITRFARTYTPFVVGAAVLLAFIPPLFTGDLRMWIMRALTFLVISCPCALVLSVPLTFFGGIGAASRRGILIKGSCYLEALAKCKVAVFDKTGTLTEGTFSVQAIHPGDLSEKELIEYAALAEAFSDHPIARSVRRHHGRALDLSRVSDVHEIPGLGVSALVDGKRVVAGNGKLMDRNGIAYRGCHRAGTILHLGVEDRDAGHIVISDTIRPRSEETIAALRHGGCRTVMLTGDKAAVADEVAARLALDEVHSELLPADKVALVERLLREKDPRDKLLFVGDGMNDAPVLSRADVGIAMGGIGSDASIEAADVVIMDDDIGKLGTAMAISRRTLAIVRENIVFALGAKGLFLLLGAIGLSSLWLAVFADVGVSVLAILNAMRALRTKGEKGDGAGSGKAAAHRTPASRGGMPEGATRAA